jgi:hypothetical protein
MNVPGTLQLLFLAGLSFAVVAHASVSLLVPWMVRWTAFWAPAIRHRALLLVCASPMLLTCAAVLSVMLPSLSGGAHHHCLEHHGHPHLCFVHVPTHAGGWMGWVVIACAAAWLGARLGLGAMLLRRGYRAVRELLAVARHDAVGAVWIIPTDETLCVSLGLLHPRVMVSEGLLAEAAADELEIMLAHEHEHARRRDSLWRALAGFASALLMPGSRHLLLSHLALSAEHVCDEHAGTRTGDRLRVAETILAIERKLSTPNAVCGNALASSFGASSVPERVEAMLALPRTAGSYVTVLAALLLAIVAIVAAHDHLHHITESLLAAAVFTH